MNGRLRDTIRIVRINTLSKRVLLVLFFGLITMVLSAQTVLAGITSSQQEQNDDRSPAALIQAAG